MACRVRSRRRVPGCRGAGRIGFRAGFCEIGRFRAFGGRCRPHRHRRGSRSGVPDWERAVGGSGPEAFELPAAGLAAGLGLLGAASPGRLRIDGRSTTWPGGGALLGLEVERRVRDAVGLGPGSAAASPRARRAGAARAGLGQGEGRVQVGDPVGRISSGLGLKWGETYRARPEHQRSRLCSVASWRRSRFSSGCDSSKRSASARVPVDLVELGDGLAVTLSRAISRRATAAGLGDVRARPRCRGRRARPVAELGRGGQEVEGERACSAVQAPARRRRARASPIGRSASRSRRRPAQRLDDLGRPAREPAPRASTSSRRSSSQASSAPERPAVAEPPLHPLGAVDPEAEDGDLVDQPGLVLVLGLQRVEPLGGPLLDRARGPRARRPRRRAVLEGVGPGSGLSFRGPRSSGQLCISLIGGQLCGAASHRCDLGWSLGPPPCPGPLGRPLARAAPRD